MAVQNYRVNNRIRVPEVRLIDEDGEQMGIVNTDDAKRRAQAADLDLVEVSPQARPPVCKIMDFGKFKYQQRKKEKKGGHKHASQLKELRVRPAIDTHDLSYRLDSGRRFLNQGHKVQVVCIFKGRQLAHPEHGYEVMRKVSEALADISKVESHPKMMGRRMTMLLSHKSPGGIKAPEKPTAQRDRDTAAKPARDTAAKPPQKPAEGAPAEAPAKAQAKAPLPDTAPAQEGAAKTGAPTSGPPADSAAGGSGSA